MDRLNSAVSVTPETVVFVRDAQKQKKVIVVRNDGPKALMLKMKSTLAGALRMKPVYGSVAAGANTTIKLDFHSTSNLPDRIASTSQQISVGVELRWSERRNEADRPTKHIHGESTKERITVVLAEAPDVPMSPRVFWTGKDEEKAATGHKKQKRAPKDKAGDAHGQHATADDDAKPNPAATNSETPQNFVNVDPNENAHNQLGDAASSVYLNTATTNSETPQKSVYCDTKGKAGYASGQIATTQQQTNGVKPNPAITNSETLHNSVYMNPATANSETPQKSVYFDPNVKAGYASGQHATTQQQTNGVKPNPSITNSEMPQKSVYFNPATTNSETPQKSVYFNPATSNSETPQKSVYFNPATSNSEMPQKSVYFDPKDKAGYASGQHATTQQHTNAMKPKPTFTNSESKQNSVYFFSRRRDKPRLHTHRQNLSS
ncbi:hypothetical protein AAVH_36002 [Aphelenchoides avenae]|nr:hypothetical protein AAVH_36002 [Aphelenchus avenae]